MKKSFRQTVCAMRIHCGVCRMLEEGRATRQRWLATKEVGELAQQGVDFACWNGLAWGEVPKATMRATHVAINRVLPVILGQPPSPLPLHQWPAEIREIAASRQPGEIGVGDTAKRIFGLLGKAVHLALAALLVDCRCDQKRDWLNARFPYSALSAP